MKRQRNRRLTGRLQSRPKCILNAVTFQMASPPRVDEREAHQQRCNPNPNPNPNGPNPNPPLPNRWNHRPSADIGWRRTRRERLLHNNGAEMN